MAIIKRNLITPISISIYTLAIILYYLNQLRDALFLSSVITLNIILAIIQEARARNALKKLELLSAPRAKLLHENGSIEEVTYDQVAQGQHIILRLGDEIPADGEVVSSEGFEVNEGIMTGESAPIEKYIGDKVYAASSVVAGSATMSVTAVGSDTRAGIMTSSLKRYQPTLTPIQHSISTAITYLTYGALFLAVLILIVYGRAGHNAVLIVRTISAAAVSIVPEGLLLASTLLLAYGSIRLSRAKVLPQKLSAIEAMALLDVLAVDKTGTLTTDEISFEGFEKFHDANENIDQLIGIASREANSGSETGEAIIAGFALSKGYKVIEKLPFSSVRKMSGVKFTYQGAVYGVMIGAPEYIYELAPVGNEQARQVKDLERKGKRVIAVALTTKADVSLKKPDGAAWKAQGVIILKNELRQGVQKTVDYLQNNGVRIKVISGDSPETVKFVSENAGINFQGKVITGSKLRTMSKVEFKKAAMSNDIFARVLPEQKERLVKVFKEFGYFTGMVGDGVNDALALKKSDLGVAMYSGAAATRRVADIVLTDNSFNSLPLGMRVGNRIIQAIEIVATLFFHRIILGAILLIFTLLLGYIYPFDPRHITFINIFLVTLPTITLTLFPPSPRQRISPKYFWQDTLISVIPIAVLSGLITVAAYTWLTSVYPTNVHGVSTTTVIIATFFGIYLVFLIPKMFDVKYTKKTRLAALFYVVAILAVVIPSFGLRIARDFFEFSTPVWRNAWPLIILIFTTAVMQWFIADQAGKRIRERSVLPSGVVTKQSAG